MKFIFLVFGLFFLAEGQDVFLPYHGLPPAKPPQFRTASPVWKVMRQKMDNLNPFNTKYWLMRYIENNEFYKPGGPIFVMLGGEWAISDQWLQSGQMYEMARLHNAYMFYIEHRYYGKSYPTKTLSTQNLKYLTTDQALLDNVHFIREIKKIIPGISRSKVIVFGGSYGGTLATWMRQFYPDLVHAAVSSSGPLLAKLSFSDYHQIIKYSLGAKCASIIKNASDEIHRLISSGLAYKIKKDFNLCVPLDPENEYDTIYLFTSIAGKIGNLVQYATPSIIEILCDKLENPPELSDYDRLANYMRSDTVCRENYEVLLNIMRNESLYSGDSRQWYYQMCTSFGFFQTSWTEDSLYGKSVPLYNYHKWCKDFFGSRITPGFMEMGVAKTNIKYGALNPKVTRVVTVHGTFDPWSALGLPASNNPNAPSIYVNGTSHCADLFGLSSDDPLQLYEAKLKVREYIAKWLDEP